METEVSFDVDNLFLLNTEFLKAEEPEQDDYSYLSRMVDDDETF